MNPDYRTPPPADGHIRIGVGAGFQGDRLDPALVLVEYGHLDWLVLECLAERTIALAQQNKLQNPKHGYDLRLEQRILPLLPLLVKHRTRLITNMGAANPLVAGERIVELARGLGLSISVAVLMGDDVLSRVDLQSRVLEGGAPLSDFTRLGNLVSANAYLGSQAILPAIESKADIIITGRVADPSLFLAPIIDYHRWGIDEWDRLARGTVVGHLLECAGQLTGGYFAEPGVKDVPNMAYLGFPYADVDVHGCASISKVQGTGGLINTRTVREQLYYEVLDPAGYLTPDVQANFTAVRMEDISEPSYPDRIRVWGALGIPHTDQYKLSIGYLAGWMGEGCISYAGPGAKPRALLAADIIRERCRDIPGLAIHFIGLDALHRGMSASSKGINYGGEAEHVPYEVRLRAVGLVDDLSMAERIGHEVEALATNGPGGGGGFERRVAQKIGIVSILMPRAEVPTEVFVLRS